MPAFVSTGIIYDGLQSKLKFSDLHKQIKKNTNKIGNVHELAVAF